MLKDDKKVQILKLRYVDDLTMDAIGKMFNISGAAVRQMLVYCNWLIKRNANIRRLAVEIGIWDKDKLFSDDRVSSGVKRGAMTTWIRKSLGMPGEWVG